MRTLPLLLIITFTVTAAAQKRTVAVHSTGGSGPRAGRSAEVGQQAVVVDETLAVLRGTPSLFAEPVHRMSRGRRVQILGVTEADGVKFYKVAAPPTSTGWVQADAVFGKFRPSDEKRLFELVQALDGFDQIEAAAEFFQLYPTSQFKPALLLLFGDLLEDLAVNKLSKEANSRLKRAEMAATGAPLHSYFLNFVSLDRYRKLGITFLFSPTDRKFHYNGDSWREILAKFPSATETGEARKRLDALPAKINATAASK
ncbi:MAG TPA: SH3 domain-containing protein [Pyrinomonadaceae bacterium]|nr:SH3 domain-containing protein [Pyrinomonadaceae bacterium]